MISLYTRTRPSGATDVEVLDPAVGAEAWEQQRNHLRTMLKARGESDVVALLDRLPWMLFNGTNIFEDKFRVLYTSLPVEVYAEACALPGDPAVKKAAEILAKRIQEISPQSPEVRHVVFEVASEDSLSPVVAPAPRVTTATVNLALVDAEHLLSNGRPVSAVDRVHTALQGYLRAVCREAGIDFAEKDGLGALIKKLVTNHAALSTEVPHRAHAKTMVRSLGPILDAMDPIRNRGSVAHSENTLLEEAEAMLVINSARTVLHYIDAKLRTSPNNS